MVRYLFYTIGDLTYQSPLVLTCSLIKVFFVCCFQGNYIRENYKMVAIQGDGMHASAVIILPIFFRRYDSRTTYCVNLSFAAVK